MTENEPYPTHWWRFSRANPTQVGSFPIVPITLYKIKQTTNKKRLNQIESTTKANHSAPINKGVLHKFGGQPIRHLITIIYTVHTAFPYFHCFLFVICRFPFSISPFYSYKHHCNTHWYIVEALESLIKNVAQRLQATCHPYYFNHWL